ncbi:MAG: metal ABC transporter permease [Spirochaetes bacterium]|jgi:zinc transport system permease protein|nr:metal ABC transporter permease [Spirochaetota bacterium]
MTEFFYALINPEVSFIRYALIAGVLSSIAFGIIGTFVVVKKMTYIAGAISHTALGGIGFSLWITSVTGIGFFPPIMGALLISLITGLIISYTIIKGDERLDSIIGTIWAVGMSIGLIFIYITPGYGDPMSYLFGNILLISANDLAVIIVLNIVIILLSVLFHNQFLAIFFDEEFAQVRGVKTHWYQIILILLISLTIILLITIVGIVMVIALLTIPASIAGIFSKKMKVMMFLAVIICALVTVTGLIGSYLLNLPTGSVTILFSGILYLLANIFKFFTKK